jgi:ATP-dependent RNA helicase DHX37/DHR1
LKGSGPRPSMKRRPSVDEARQQLPVVAEEQPIMEAILLNPVVVICGETGSGKTTQIPQMLYEAGFGFPGSDNPGMIAVTQPRRVAAVSLAVRVASELNQGPQSKLVAHQIRYSSTTSQDTAIKFMTDGVLLRELATDFLLSRYSVVVVDEAHERGVNTDVLVGVLSRVAKLREKLWREKKDNVKVSMMLLAVSDVVVLADCCRCSHCESLSCRPLYVFPTSLQTKPCLQSRLQSLRSQLDSIR